MKTAIDILKKHMLIDGFNLVVDLKKSRGSYIFDNLTKKHFLDLYAYFASLTVGHNHPMMFEKRFLEELQLAAVANPANSDVYTDEFADFVEVFSGFCGHDFKHYFFVAGGACAVENALKTAFDWKIKKNLAKGMVASKPLCVIHFQEAFHGRTGYAMSISSAKPVHTEGFPLLKWPRVLNPKIDFPLDRQNLELVKAKEDKSISQIKSAIQLNKNAVAAIIIEPIQGEGGDNHFRKEFLAKLKEIADANDIMLIFDEVQTGFGLTGRIWAYQHMGVIPDILVFGKKAQVCGLMAGKKVDQVKENVFTVSGRINSTWGGNLVDMVRCKQYIKIIRAEKLIDNAGQTGKYILKNLVYLGNIFPGTISNIRGLGLMIAFDLPDTDKKKAMIQDLWAKGIIALSTGVRGIRIRPALNFSMKDARFFIEQCHNILSCNKANR
jgi:L-lysine 6-transaminase